MLKILLTGFLFILTAVFIIGCTEKSSPVSVEPIVIDSTPAPAGRLVFVRDGKRFTSDTHFKDGLGIHHGAYAFYQISSQELSIYGRREGEKPEVLRLTTKISTKQKAPLNVADYTIEFQEGIILQGNAFQNDSLHLSSYTLTKFDLGAGLVSGNFVSTLQQTFPINKKANTKIEYGSFKDLPMIIMD